MSAMATNGGLSSSDFHEAVSWLSIASDKLGDTWQLNVLPESTQSPDVYLSRKTFKKIEVSAASTRELEAEQLIFLQSTNEDVINDDSDVGYLPVADSFVCQTDHHIVYSHSYCVPVMYFNVYKPGGQLLSLDEIWSCARREMHGEDVIDVWSFITQQEHPYLRRPFFFLHPCHTADFMAQVRNNIRTPREYLLSWLSVVSRAVQLELSLRYALQLDTDGEAANEKEEHAIQNETTT